MTRVDKPKLKYGLARHLRKVLTPPEVRLWVRLRSRPKSGFVIRRQHPIGPYVLDFYCPEVKLAIEVDGGQHTHDAAMAHDQVRDAWLLEQGIATLRIPSSHVMANPDEETNGVFDVISQRLKSRTEK